MPIPSSSAVSAVSGWDAMPYGVQVAHFDENDAIAEERDCSQPKAPCVQVYRSYAKGEHLICFSDEMREMLRGLPLEYFSDNAYGQVLLINADRLKVTDFNVSLPAGVSEEEGQRLADEVTAFIKDLRVKAHFDSEQNKINKAVIRDGNHAVGISWDEDTQRVLFHQEPWWDGYSGMYVVYGDNGLPAYAVREWTGKESAGGYIGTRGILQKFADFLSGSRVSFQDRKTYRYRTLYFPHEIQKYRCEEGQAGKWQKYQPQDEPWPIPWVKRDGSPLGIPVIHFAVGGDGHYGEPVAGMPVVANQDLLNDTRLNIAVVAREEGFSIKVLSGFPVYRKNPDGTDDVTQQETYPVYPGVLYISSDPGASATAIPPGSVDALIKVYDLTLGSISQQTQTPHFLLTVGANTSGAAILRAEAPLAGKAQEQTESLGPSYATLMHRAIELYNARNRAGITINEDALISPVWADTSKPDAMAVLEFEKARNENEREEMILEQEKQAIEEGRPVYIAPDDSARRLATVTVPLEEQQAAA